MESLYCNWPLALEISAERCEGILHVIVVVCVHGYEYDTSMDGKQQSGGCAIRGTHLKFISNWNLVRTRSSIKSVSVLQLFWNYAHKMAVSLLCFAQNFKMIGYLQKTLRANETSRDLSLKCISDGYPLLHKAPVTVNFPYIVAILFFKNAHNRHPIADFPWSWRMGWFLWV